MLRLFVSLVVILAFVSDSTRAEDVTLALQQGLNGFEGVQDVYISVDSTLASRNLGAMHELCICQFGGVALIRYDLTRIPKYAVVKDATIELFCASVGFAEEEIRRDWPVGIYEFPQPWKEGTGHNLIDRRDGATGDTFDGVNAWPKGKAVDSAGVLMASTTIVGGERRWYSWKLDRSVVQEWVSGKLDNHGMLIWGKPPGKAVSFTQSKSTAVDRRPILRLQLSVPRSGLPVLGGLLASDLTWEKYVADCGLDAQDKNEAQTEEVFREKYHGDSFAGQGLSKTFVSSHCRTATSSR